MAFHLDIGHIIPPTANTMLFQLLVIGLVRDSKNCRVYHRSACDQYLLELPNSPNNKSIAALYITSLLPTEILSVDSRFLDRKRPLVVDDSPTQVVMVDDEELVYVCKQLRAYKQEKFRNDADWNVELDADISNTECFDILTEYCCPPGKHLLD